MPELDTLRYSAVLDISKVEKGLKDIESRHAALKAKLDKSSLHLEIDPASLKKAEQALSKIRPVRVELDLSHAQRQLDAFARTMVIRVGAPGGVAAQQVTAQRQQQQQQPVSWRRRAGQIAGGIAAVDLPVEGAYLAGRHFGGVTAADIGHTIGAGIHRAGAYAASHQATAAHVGSWLVGAGTRLGMTAAGLSAGNIVGGVAGAMAGGLASRAIHRHFHHHQAAPQPAPQAAPQAYPPPQQQAGYGSGVGGWEGYTSQGKTCPQCGLVVAPSANHCPRCGASFGGSVVGRVARTAGRAAVMPVRAMAGGARMVRSGVGEAEALARAAYFVGGAYKFMGRATMGAIRAPFQAAGAAMRAVPNALYHMTHADMVGSTWDDELSTARGQLKGLGIYTPKRQFRRDMRAAIEAEGISRAASSVLDERQRKYGVQFGTTSAADQGQAGLQAGIARGLDTTTASVEKFRQSLEGAAAAARAFVEAEKKKKGRPPGDEGGASPAVRRPRGGGGGGGMDLGDILPPEGYGGGGGSPLTFARPAAPPGPQGPYDVGPSGATRPQAHGPFLSPEQRGHATSLHRLRTAREERRAGRAEAEAHRQELLGELQEAGGMHVVPEGGDAPFAEQGKWDLHREIGQARRRTESLNAEKIRRAEEEHDEALGYPSKKWRPNQSGFGGLSAAANSFYPLKGDKDTRPLDQMGLSGSHAAATDSTLAFIAKANEPTSWGDRVRRKMASMFGRRAKPAEVPFPEKHTSTYTDKPSGGAWDPSQPVDWAGEYPHALPVVRPPEVPSAPGVERSWRGLKPLTQFWKRRLIGDPKWKPPIPLSEIPDYPATTKLEGADPSKLTESSIWEGKKALVPLPDKEQFKEDNNYQISRTPRVPPEPDVKPPGRKYQLHDDMYGPQHDLSAAANPLYPLGLKKQIGQAGHFGSYGTLSDQGEALALKLVGQRPNQPASLGDAVKSFVADLRSAGGAAKSFVSSLFGGGGGGGGGAGGAGGGTTAAATAAAGGGGGGGGQMNVPTRMGTALRKLAGKMPVGRAVGVGFGLTALNEAAGFQNWASDQAFHTNLAYKFGGTGEQMAARQQDAQAWLDKASTAPIIGGVPLIGDIANLAWRGMMNGPRQGLKKELKTIARQQRTQRLLAVDLGIRSQAAGQEAATDIANLTGDPYAQQERAIQAAQKQRGYEGVAQQTQWAEAGMRAKDIDTRAKELRQRNKLQTAAERAALNAQTNLTNSVTAIEGVGAQNVARATLGRNPEGAIFASAQSELDTLTATRLQKFQGLTSTDAGVRAGAEAAERAARGAVGAKRTVDLDALDYSRRSFVTTSQASTVGAQLRMSGSPIEAMRREAAINRPMVMEQAERQYGKGYGAIAGRAYDVQNREAMQGAVRERGQMLGGMNLNTAVTGLQTARRPYEADLARVRGETQLGIEAARPHGQMAIAAATAQGAAQERLLREQRRISLKGDNISADTDIRRQQLLLGNAPMQAQAAEIVGGAQRDIATNADQSPEGRALLAKRVQASKLGLQGITHRLDLENRARYAREMTKNVSFQTERALVPEEDEGKIRKAVAGGQADLDAALKGSAPGKFDPDAVMRGAGAAIGAGFANQGGPTPGQDAAALKQINDVLSSIKAMVAQAIAGG